MSEETHLPLAQRIAETIEDFTEANPTTISDIFTALEYVHACVSRYSDKTPPHKMI